jgi:hypothetical protein
MLLQQTISTTLVKIDMESVTIFGQLHHFLFVSITFLPICHFLLHKLLPLDLLVTKFSLEAENLESPSSCALS